MKQKTGPKNIPVSRALTLIELLVTLFIVGLLTAASVPLIRQLEKRDQLRMAAEDIRSAILEAKSYALAPQVGKSKIDSYAIFFYGADYQDSNKRHAYEILECSNPSQPDSPDCKGGTETSVVNSFHKLPKDVKFGEFNWNSNSIKEAQLRFSVAQQGEIINNFVGTMAASSPDRAKIIIFRFGSGEKLTIEVMKETGAISITK